MKTKTFSCNYCDKVTVHSVKPVNEMKELLPRTGHQVIYVFIKCLECKSDGSTHLMKDIYDSL